MMSADERDNQSNSDSNSAKAPAQSRVITIADERIDSRDLFVTSRQITIVHGGETYSLRLTAQNKLILTK